MNDISCFEQVPMFTQSTSNSGNCVHCKIGSADIQILGCNCLLHTRCTRLTFAGEPFVACPHCKSASKGIYLLPLSFKEIDEEASKAAAVTVAPKSSESVKSKATSREKRSASSQDEELLSTAVEEPEPRTGRWTPEETAFVDELILKFGDGVIPVPQGEKLHDFLASILLCKGSRLTKKMKNAKLSSKTFQKTLGYIADVGEALEFSALEEAFLLSIPCPVQRSVIKFHMQRRWREFFCQVCSDTNQSLDADAWLNSIEEVERRSSLAKIASRMKKRKQLIQHAIRKDSESPETGVIIDCNGLAEPSPQYHPDPESDESEDSLLSYYFGVEGPDLLEEYCKPSNGDHSSNPSTFLQKVMKFFSDNNVPFEHVDLWTPSYVPVSSAGENWSSMNHSSTCNAKCRLVFGGCATVNPRNNQAHRFSSDEYFAMISFGKYSERFSFEIGSGLPGRIVQSGISTWDQNIQNAPHKYFERIVGAIQFGVRTVVGIPISSPVVGRIIMVLYSTHDVVKDESLVERLIDVFTQLAPSPKLIVDIGVPNTSKHSSIPNATSSENRSSSSSNSQDSRVGEVLAILAENTPTDGSTSLSSLLTGFISLRHLLLKSTRDDCEKEMLRMLLNSYSAFLLAKRPSKEIATLLAMDFMFMTKQGLSSQQTRNYEAIFSSHVSSSSLTTLEQQQHGYHQQSSCTFAPLVSNSVLPCISYTHHPS